MKRPRCVVQRRSVPAVVAQPIVGLLFFMIADVLMIVEGVMI